MPNMNNVGVKGWYIKTEPSNVFSFDVNAFASLENTFSPFLQKSYTVNQNNSSGINSINECS